MASLASGCILPTGGGSTTEGGANANDRTTGGDPGETLLTGVMEISPSGHYAIMQRNTVTVLLDIRANKYVELPLQLQRIAFSKKRDVGYALMPDGSVVGLDLATGNTLWTAAGPYPDVSLLRVNDEDDSIVLVTSAAVQIIDPQTGAARVGVPLPGPASFGAFLSKSHRVVLVSDVVWTAHTPNTSVTTVDLTTGDYASIGIPNCEANPAVLPDESRILISPTFCAEDQASNPNGPWTNPDPVSVIEVDAKGALTFNKNLPGFGPVALSPDGSRAVAYLDTKRVDPSMFSDKSQIPGANAPEYHLLVIDPKTLAFTVSPIGDALPRFAMSRDGKGLLVDASVKIQTRTYVQANASLSITPHGITADASAKGSIFGEDTPFGYFDLSTHAFTKFVGTHAGLDRFVQLGDENTVVTLEKRSDGLGGIPYIIDLGAKTTAALTGDYGTGVRDVGLLPDGKTILLRFRQAAAQVGNSLFARETYCFSTDGVSCSIGRVDYQATVAFATVNTNDCANMGHDCW
jgi:hypothetical protein